MKIGAQLYTARDFCKTPEGLAESLARVAEIGYTTVQVSGTCAYDPEWLNGELKKNGLECVITHIPGERIAKEPEIVAREHNAFGCKYVGLGHYAFGDETDAVEKFASLYLPAAKTLKANGKYFMYHNHNGEFRKLGGKLILQSLIELLPAEYIRYLLGTGCRRGSGTMAGEARGAHSLHSLKGLRVRAEDGSDRRGKYQFRSCV